jgi:hypothetical protein
MAKNIIVAFGDIHDQLDYIHKIREIEVADWVIITGDLTDRGDRTSAKKVIDYIKKYNINILAQIGNMDHSGINNYLSELGINLHGHGYKLTEVLAVFGVGGSTPTPFGTPTEYSEKEIASFLCRAYKEIKHVPHKILVSHTPPYGTKVDKIPLMGGKSQHVGSKIIMEFIKRYQPDICLTGHIHEAREVDKIGKTVILNPGTISQGYIVVEWDGLNLKAMLSSYIFKPR